MNDLSGARPYVTVVLTGRNDDTSGDFASRFFAALRFNHERLAEADVPHEFVFVEWSPRHGTAMLASSVAAEFAFLGPSQLACYVVDPPYHQALSLNPRVHFQDFLARNVGIRRAAGTFVLSIGHDIYLSRGIVQGLAAQALDRGTLYRAARHDLKSHSDLSVVDWSVLEDERNCDIVGRIAPPYYAAAAGDFLLVDRDSFHRLRGFNEVYRTSKAHTDRNFCVKAHSSGVRLTDIGSPVYHVGRATLRSQRAARPDGVDAPHARGRLDGDVIYVNPPNWGLGGAPERRVDALKTYLDFDWRAIGPMVDLKRLVLPASRTEITC